jgi:hypothetical protein
MIRYDFVAYCSSFCAQFKQIKILEEHPQLAMKMHISIIIALKQMDNPTILLKQQHVIRNWQASPLGLRVSEHTEMVGLDISEHSAYPQGFYFKLINFDIVQHT